VADAVSRIEARMLDWTREYGQVSTPDYCWGPVPANYLDISVSYFTGDANGAKDSQTRKVR